MFRFVFAEACCRGEDWEEGVVREAGGLMIDSERLDEVVCKRFKDPRVMEQIR